MAIEGKGNQVELAGIITGTIKLLIGIGVIIGLVIALLLVKLFGGRSRNWPARPGGGWQEK